MKRLYLPLFGLLLASCAADWSKPGASGQDYAAAKAACTSQAQAKFPPKVTQLSVIASPLPQPWTPEVGSPPVPNIDQNAYEREQSIRLCLLANGWRPASE